ncbi:HigA family addiction module antitoxin [Cognatilysobacter bugurensis]|uniref:Transcriptional regulator n=1 Tax=Cognatilysobacter bugurensis TaxID=543356 RepID=A0A918SYM7_9GAMM|nr:HigA family addiction module antitoxin [Lysobacter bugurensis]GHA76590.1 transcriptional regulator [Lysobacter bugurensis]
MGIAQTFAPGEFLKEELEARGWSQTELAEIMGRPVRLINELIAGKKGITPETAVQLGDALGTGAELWMNLESQYQLSKVAAGDGQVARRAELYSKFPVREMVKRGWLAASRHVGELEQGLRAFFGVEDLDAPVRLAHAAKRTVVQQEATPLQLAWLIRARQIASEMVVGKFTHARLEAALPKLSALLSAPEEARHVPAILADAGVRYVVVEPIPGTKIDGACFWLGSDKPVVVMSLRLDRIDNFWFVLRHELEHVLQGHGRDRDFILDVELDGACDHVDVEEATANQAGASFSIPVHEFEGFVARVGPFFAEERVLGFAQRLNIHPGLVVGQLQRRLGRYDFLRKHQAKIRHVVTSTARTDGWGVLSV